MRIRLFTRWLLVLCVTIPGCTTLREWNNEVLSLTRESPLTLVKRMSDLDSREERNRLAESVLARYENNPDSANTLRLAIIQSLPGHDLHDDEEALVLLESSRFEELSKSEQRLGAWLAANLEQRIALRELNAALREDLESVQVALDRAREKIEILTRIEETIGPGSEGKQ